MIEWDTGALLHTLVSLLSWPTHLALMTAAVVSVWELGALAGERWSGMKRLREGHVDLQQVDNLARGRVERADTLARIGPMLGLMGTLIPLGPGLAALGRGDVGTLAQAVTVAFDTTVLGLAVGIVGFLVGKARRRWYDGLLDELERRGADESEEVQAAEQDRAAA